MRLIVSSDIHGTIMNYSYVDEVPSNMGVIKLLPNIRKDIIDNTIVIDNGDLLTGSPMIAYFKQSGYKDNPTLYYLNNVVNIYNLGNHDFDFGSAYLEEYLKNFYGDCITGNVFYHNKRMGHEYLIKEVEGKKVVFVGCLTKGVLDWEKKENVEGIEIIDCFEYVKETIAKVRKEVKPDLVVVIYHGGLEKDLDGKWVSSDDGIDQGYRMCKELDFDILISGHQHISISGNLFGKIVCQCTNRGREYIVIDYDFKTKTGEAILKEPTEAINLDDLKVFENLEKETQAYLNQVIGHVDNIDLKINNVFEAQLHKCPLISLTNKILMEKTGAMLASYALTRNVPGFNRDITLRDVINTYPFDNSFEVLEMTGKMLRKYLEKNAEYFAYRDEEIVVDDSYIYPALKLFNYDMLDGVEYTIKVTNEKGKRIIELKYQGKDVKDDDIFTVALSNYRANGGGDFTFLKQCKKLKTIPDSIVEIVTQYIMNKKHLVVEHQENIKVII